MYYIPYLHNTATYMYLVWYLMVQAKGDSAGYKHM